MAELGTSRRNPPKFAEVEENVAAIDLISSLPESLLCEILSFLPTKEAVATSILSNRWRSLWTLVPDIDLREDSLGRGNYENRTNFAHIVSSILTQRKTKRVRKFRLSCSGYNCDVFHVKEWVSVAIAGNVEQMDLSLGTIYLPRLSFSTCQRIVVLKLREVTLDISTAVHFPKLKTLALWSHVNDGILKWVNSACPVLEDFSAIINFSALTDFEFPIKISMASLKKLDLFFVFSLNEIEINTPSLERLILGGSNMPDFSGGELQNVVEANLVWDQNSDDTAVKLLKALDGVQSLILSCNEDVPTDPNLDIPEFSNLIRLKLDLESLDTNFLLNMLQKCHKLEVLVIYKVEFGAEDLNWIEPTSVPICVSSHLTLFEFRGSNGLENELNFIAYILKNASFLQTVTINTADKLNSEAKLHLFKELSKLPRGSDTCELAFD